MKMDKKSGVKKFFLPDNEIDKNFFIQFYFFLSKIKKKVVPLHFPISRTEKLTLGERFLGKKKFFEIMEMSSKYPL